MRAACALESPLVKEKQPGDGAETGDPPASVAARALPALRSRLGPSLGSAGPVKRRVVLGCALALVSLVTVFVQDEVCATAKPSSAVPRAMIFGSSSVKGSLGRVIESDLRGHGYEVTRLGVVGAGLARPDYRDMRALVDTLPLAEGAAMVFVYLGVNDGQALWLRPGDRQRPGERWLPWSHPRWPTVYRRRAQRLYETLCQRGARQVVVLLPVEVTKPRLERKLERIRALQREAAERVPCAMAVSTKGEDGFVADGKPTRLADGFHLTLVGARRVWQRVKRRAALALAPTQGPWAR